LAALTKAFPLDHMGLFLVLARMNRFQLSFSPFPCFSEVQAESKTETEESRGVAE